MVCGQWASFSACLPLLPLTDRYCTVAARVEANSTEVINFVVRYHIFRWTKAEFARSSTSTWTRFMRPLNSATIQVSRASRWRSAIRPNAASLLQRAMRRGVSEFARQCRQPSRFGSARNSCLSRQGSTVYREVSKQIHAIFKNYTPLVEPLSLDEAYLDVTDNLKGIPTAWETAKEIRARIYDETKLTASAGISCNKFLAKLASNYRKPNGRRSKRRKPSRRS